MFLRHLSPVLFCLLLFSPVVWAAAPAGPDAAVPLPLAKAAGFTAPAASPNAAPTPAMTEVPTSLATAPNAQAVLSRLKITLSPAQKRFLDDNKFLLVPKARTVFAGHFTFTNAAYQESYDEMIGMFDQVCGELDAVHRRPENTRFVGPDVVLHAMGKYFENALEYLEQTELAPRLAVFLTDLRARALAQAKTASGQLAEHLQTVAAELTVPLVLLGNVKPPQAAASGGPARVAETPDKADSLPVALRRLKALAKEFPPALVAKLEAELKLLSAAKSWERSPLFGDYDPDGSVKTDYTQYRPRGHYAKNSLLRGYFRAMLFLGRTGWPLAPPAGLSDALLVVRLLAEPGRDGRPLVVGWRRLMDITGFFAGLPDDTEYTALRDFTVRVLGRDRLSLADAVDHDVLAKLGANLEALPPPRILSDILADPAIGETTKKQLLARTRTFRLFGQRFSPDAWILSRLTAGQEKTDLRLPAMPTALFVPAALGNATARQFAADVLAGPGQGFTPAEVAAFLGRLDATANDLARLPQDSWYDSLASAWLHVLSTLKTDAGPGWPAYMQSPPFPAKRIETVLGSYAERKHTTLLYAKPNYAEAGDGAEEGTPPPVPKGFVEPNPAFWAALLRLADTAKAGFAHYKILPEELEDYGRLAWFRNDLSFFAALADKELAGVPIPDDDYEKLRLSNLSYVTRPFGDTVLDPDQCRSALVADIHTDAVSGQALYEATAAPSVLLVLAGDARSPRLTVGVAYNHYEFARPLAQGRLTDQAWRADVYAKPPKLPEKNSWYQGLRVQ